MSLSLFAEGVSEFFGCHHTPSAPLQLSLPCLTMGFIGLIKKISSYIIQAIFTHGFKYLEVACKAVQTICRCAELH